MTVVKSIEYGLLIHGEWRPAKSGDWFEVENPATGEPIARIANAGPEDVAEAVGSSRRAFDSGEWSTMSGDARGRIMWRIADLIEERQM